jgi:AraC-like DNA-binding protein
MLCTADKNQFTLKSGEVTFHKPNEYHNLSGNRLTPPNVSIITFECDSTAMGYFEQKIIRLNAEEKTLLSMLFEEGLSCFRLEDERDPLRQNMLRIEGAPFGSSQMTKNLLEIFLISLHRRTDMLAKRSRYRYKVNGVAIPFQVKEIIDFLEKNVYKKLTVEDIAREVGKSASALKSLFSTYKDGGIMKYFNQLKIEEAKKLIREGSMNFAQISAQLNFDTPQYFSTCFKRFTNMSPQEYKNSILQ